MACKFVLLKLFCSKNLVEFSGQIFCQLAVFLVYGFVKNLRENIYSQTVLAFSVIRHTCRNLARWEFSVARLDYFKLIDLILYKISWSSELQETRTV